MSDSKILNYLIGIVDYLCRFDDYAIVVTIII